MTHRHTHDHSHASQRGKVFLKFFGKCAGWFTAGIVSFVGAISFVSFLPVLGAYFFFQVTFNLALGLGLTSGLGSLFIEHHVYTDDIKKSVKLFFSAGFSLRGIKENIERWFFKNLLTTQLTKLLKNKDQLDLSKMIDLSDQELAHLEKDAFNNIIGKMFPRFFNFKADPEIERWYKKTVRKRIQTNIFEEKKHPKNFDAKDWLAIFKAFCKEHPQLAEQYIAAAMSDDLFKTLMRQELTDLIIDKCDIQSIKDLISKDKNGNLTSKLFKLSQEVNGEQKRIKEIYDEITKKFNKYSPWLTYFAPFASFVAAFCFGAYTYTVFLQSFAFIGVTGLAAVFPAGLIALVIIVPVALWWYQSLANAIAFEFHIKIARCFRKLFFPNFEGYSTTQKVAHVLGAIIGTVLLACIFSMSIFLCIFASKTYALQILDAAASLGVKVTKIGAILNTLIVGGIVLIANLLYSFEHIIEIWKKLSSMAGNAWRELRKTTFQEVKDGIYNFVTDPYKWLGVLIALGGVALMILHFASEAAMTVYGAEGKHDVANNLINKFVGLFTKIKSAIIAFFARMNDEFLDDGDFLIPDETNHHGHDHGFSYGKIVYGLRWFGQLIIDTFKSLVETVRSAWNSIGQEEAGIQMKDISADEEQQESVVQNPAGIQSNEFVPITQYLDFNSKKSIEEPQSSAAAYQPFFFKAAIVNNNKCESPFFSHISESNVKPICALILN